jgi:quercetin dioxygenase-like cupin family protein
MLDDDVETLDRLGSRTNRAAFRGRRDRVTQIIEIEDLADGRRFEGDPYGGVALSFFVIALPPGDGPDLHQHPYEEVFVVQEGLARFTVGDETYDVTGGHVVVAPANTPHRFVNAGSDTLRSVNIHPTSRMITEWLEGQQ